MRIKIIAQIGILLLVTIIFSAVTYMRNSVWHDEKTLWEDTVHKSPLKARGYNFLGNYYKDNGISERASELYLMSLRIEPNAVAHSNLGVLYASKGINDMAIEHYLEAISIDHRLAEPYFNLAVLYIGLGNIDEAKKLLVTTLEIKPGHNQARQFLEYINQNN